MKCFHHNDMDGHASGAVVAWFEGNNNPNDYIEVDYVQKLPIDKISKGEKVYFVDYSFSENTVESLKKILKITENIIWIDHHNSSLEMLKKHTELKTIRGIVKSGISGAALTYMYLYGKKYEDIPMFLKYVSDYDCFHLELPNVLEFKYGVDLYDNNPLSDLWKRLLENDKIVDNIVLDEVIDVGTIIKKYKDNEYERLRKSYSYEVDIEGYKGIVINSTLKSSLIFGDMIDKYDVCLVWNYDGMYRYSIYSKTVDVSKIAEKFGGGGHKGAAGFFSDEKIF